MGVERQRRSGSHPTQPIRRQQGLAVNVLRGRAGEHNLNLPGAAAPQISQRPQAAALLLLPWSGGENWSDIDTVINHNAKCIDLTLLLVRCDLRRSKFVALMVSVGPEV